MEPRHARGSSIPLRPPARSARTGHDDDESPACSSPLRPSGRGGPDAADGRPEPARTASFRCGYPGPHPDGPRRLPAAGPDVRDGAPAPGEPAAGPVLAFLPQLRRQHGHATDAGRCPQRQQADRRHGPAQPVDLSGPGRPRLPEHLRPGPVLALRPQAPLWPPLAGAHPGLRPAGDAVQCLPAPAAPAVHARIRPGRGPLPVRAPGAPVPQIPGLSGHLRAGTGLGGRFLHRPCARPYLFPRRDGADPRPRGTGPRGAGAGGVPGF